jgi:Tol biopolymer transport system component
VELACPSEEPFVKPSRRFSALLIAAAVALACVVVPALAAKPRTGHSAGAAKKTAKARIVYEDTTEDFGTAIYTIGADGKGKRRIRSGGQDEDPSWGPGHRSIAYIHYGQLFVMRADGKHARRVSNVLASTPAWSPGGKRIAFTMVHQLGEPGVDEHYTLAVGTVRPDGTGLRRLTPFYPSEQTDLNPDWSPSGRSIAYDNGEFSGKIIRMRPNGDGKRVITPNGNDPSWSPSGKRLAFVRNNRIYVSRIDGSHARALSSCSDDDTCSDGDPTWGLNGRRIAYGHLDLSDMFSLYTIKPNRRGKRGVTLGGESLDW